jgi:hypothetical protein
MMFSGKYFAERGGQPEDYVSVKLGQTELSLGWFTANGTDVEGAEFLLYENEWRIRDVGVVPDTPSLRLDILPGVEILWFTM